jgi:hypothetical protein
MNPKSHDTARQSRREAEHASIRWLERITWPGQIIELRILNYAETLRYSCTMAGYFDTDHLADLARAAQEHTDQARGVYVTINPVQPDLLARAANRVRKAEKDSITHDDQIVRRALLVFDVDPVCPVSGVSSTAEEKARAGQVLDRVVADLARRGWPEGIRVDTGNGHRADYLIDLPNDPASLELIKNGLQAADQLFTTEGGKVDTALFNASRIIRLPGTMNRKGDSIPERPHRICQVLSVPQELAVVPLECLQALAAEFRPAAADAEKGKPQGKPIASLEGRPNGNGNGPRGDIARAARAYLEHLPNAIETQKGHNRLFHAACVLVDGFGLDRESALPILADWNQRHAEPPESDYQVEHKIDDAIKEHPNPSLAKLQASPGRPASGNGHLIDYDALTDQELGLTRASELTLANVEWLWKYLLARSELALVAGEGGLGKSMFLLAAATAVSIGAPWPDGKEQAPLGHCIIVSAEDHAETTLGPRLRAMGADLANVSVCAARLIVAREGRRYVHPMSLQDHAYWNAVLDKRPDTVLFIIDPLPSYLGRGVNDRQNSEIRAVLEPFIEDVIRPRKICLYANTHLNKAVDARTPVQRITGSIAYANIPRNVHIIVRDPAQPDRRFFKQCKCNNGPDNLDALAFRIEPTSIRTPDGQTIETAIPIFEQEPCQIDLADVLNGDRLRRGRRPIQSSKFADWLWEQLKDGRPMQLVDLVDRAREASYLASPPGDGGKPSISPLYRAMDRIPDLHPGWVVKTDEMEIGYGPAKKLRKTWQLVEVTEPQATDRDGAFDEGPDQDAPPF